MSFDKQSDVKNHLFHRTRSQIHLIEPMSQSDATGASRVEPAPVESPKGNPIERTSASDPSNLVQSATPTSVRD